MYFEIEAQRGIMSLINFARDQIPFWQDGNGTLSVNIGNTSLNQLLTPSNNDLATVNFGVAGDRNFTFSTANNFKLSVQGGFGAALSPLWPSSSPDMLILGLGLLTANVKLDVGGQAGYTYLRPLRADQKVQDILADVFKNISLSSGITESPEPGKVKAFEDGGYLKLGAGLPIAPPATN